MSAAITEVQTEGRRIADTIERVILGKRATVELCVAALLSRGHVLVEDIPGVGKTTLAKALARCLGARFRRVQFTADLLPADVTGVSIFNQKTNEFEFKPGPIFANILLADEINRATPKTQAALLECMEEAQATVDGITYPMEQPFLVIGTENPVEYRGTYPLPEAQLDRFLFRLRLGYPSPAEEVAVLDSQEKEHPLRLVQEVISKDQVVALQTAVRTVHVSPEVKNYIVSLVNATRSHPSLLLGASPRGSLGLLRAGQAKAALAGREYVLPDDIKATAEPVLAHRLIPRPEFMAEARKTEDLVRELLDRVEVPLGSVSGKDAA